MQQNKQKLSGVFSPVVTPFDHDELSLDDLRFNLSRLRHTNLKGYLALGSNGEYRSLTDAEQAEVLEVFAEEKGNKVVMVGTGCESTKETIEKSRRAAKMGFDYVSVLPPSYFAKRMDGPTLLAHYQAVATAVDVPVLLYNAPGFAGGVRIPQQTILELAQHSNIAGMKDSSPQGPGALLGCLDSKIDFQVLAGSANFFYPCLRLGAPGGIVSLANVLPEPCCRLYELFMQGQYDQAQQLHDKIMHLNQAFSGLWGVAGVKAAMAVTGFRPGLPRRPLLDIPDEAKRKIKEAIEESGLAATD